MNPWRLRRRVRARIKRIVLEDQLKAVEWVKQEYARIQQEKADRLSIELMEKMRSVIIERREKVEAWDFYNK